MHDELKKQIQSYADITEDDWQLAMPHLRLKKFRRGEYFFRAGEIEKEIGFIIRGIFRWYYINSKGDEVNYWFLFEKNFMVEYGSFITQKPSEMYIEAMQDSEILSLPRDIVLDLYRQSHRWEHFGRNIAETIYTKAASRMQDFQFRTAEERYINLLENHPDIFQKVSLSHISSYLGIKGPSLSRIRKRIAHIR
jgi:CRP-like cAMP-binding protein